MVSTTSKAWSTAKIPSPNPDRAALVALYEATNGANWKDNTNWLSDRPLSQWYGVTTNANGRVTRLGLIGNDLSGELPSELGNLTKLEVLYLHGANDLSGALPAWLGNLTNLRHLFLDGNRLSGVLPAELGNLTNLTGLGLSGNELSGTLPESLGNLTNLGQLDLFDNELSGILPASLVNLTNLKWLNLRNTQLCAPTDAAFQAWLEGIENKRSVVNCKEDGTPRQLTDIRGLDPSWSPDGRQIAFSTFSQIYVMDADGSNQQPLTSSSVSKFGPSWSPDGRQIAFYSYRGDKDRGDISLMERRWQQHTRPDHRQWRRPVSYLVSRRQIRRIQPQRRHLRDRFGWA